MPWYNQNLRRLGNKKQRLYNKARKTKSKEDIKAFKACRSNYKQILKSAQQDYYLNFLSTKIDDNSKYLFNYIKRLKKESLGIEALKYDNKIVTSASDKVEVLAKEYESVFMKEDTNNIPNILPSPFPDMDEFDIDETVFKIN